MNKNYDVIGIGASTIDIINIVDHFPNEEEVQKSYENIIQGGGPVATAIVTLARLGSNVMMIDSVGDDWIGKLIVEEYKKEKVNSELIKVWDNHTTSSATILVRKNDGARTIVFTPGNAPEVLPNDISEEIISKSRYIHINGRHLEACLQACKIAKNCGSKISFDGGSHRYREELKSIIPFVDIYIVAKDFAFSFSGTESLSEAANCLLKSGSEIVVITDGTSGSYLFTKEINCYHQKAFIVDNTVDTTGCGDSFHGAFLFGLCNNYDLFKTMKIASAVAAINSTKLGGRTALPDFDTVKKFLQQHNNKL
jgi:sugar/nucleoside kinase (ribokinase family)